MNEVIFSQQNNKSYYYNQIGSFLNDNPKTILGILIDKAWNSSDEQVGAWIKQISDLQKLLFDSKCSGHIIFEYDIVRLGKRIDVVLLIKHMVFSLEFKNNATIYKARDAEQAEDYALDLKNFHKESENLYVCPILVATDAPNRNNIIDSYDDLQIKLQYANSNSLMKCIKNVYDIYGTDEDIDFNKWYNSKYCPTPTIIEAAVEAYINNTVENIAHSEAGQDDIDKCEKKISEIIKYAKENNKKCICFVTGVPGAGKTLVGLDIASKNLNVLEGSRAVYLSGNGPLVKVLRKALSKNAYERNITESMNDSEKRTLKKNTDIAVQAFIQEAYAFRKSTFDGQEPPENVVIFDEAQRCWNKEKLSDWVKKKMNRILNESEPQYFIGTMDRRKDWSVIICLVGLGQDIYDGEVGINEWFRSAIEDYDDWELFYSDKIFEQIEDSNINKELVAGCNRSNNFSELHLETSVRSFRSNKQSEFVDNLLNGNIEKAKELYSDVIKKYPIYITRDFKRAKAWVKSKIRGSQRCGVVACSSAQRLKPEGIFVPKDIDEANWFLASKDDLRSSNAMEVVASEFKIQGLEIDYSVVCWDADLRRNNDAWEYYSFKGTKWNKRNKEEQKRYLLNAYRVLLTRARQGMVIFIPEGVDAEEDPTRNKEFYDKTFEYLHNNCGIEILN